MVGHGVTSEGRGAGFSEVGFVGAAIWPNNVVPETKPTRNCWMKRGIRSAQPKNQATATPNPLGPSAPVRQAAKAQSFRLTNAQPKNRQKTKALSGVSNQRRASPLSDNLLLVTAMSGKSITKKMQHSAKYGRSGATQCANASAQMGRQTPIGKNHQYSARLARPENWNDLARQVLMA